MHPHLWVRSPGSSLLNDSGVAAGDGIEPSYPAYETGLGPLQLSRKILTGTIRLSKIKKVEPVCLAPNKLFREFPVRAPDLLKQVSR